MRFLDRGWKSELLGDAGLLQHGVGGMAGQNLVIDREAAVRDRAVPDFVIAAAGTFKRTPMSSKDLF